MNAFRGVLGPDERGFSLAELLVTCALLGVIMAALLVVQMTGTTVAMTGSNKVEAQQLARLAMLIEEDLRLAGYGCPITACPPAATKFVNTGPNPTSTIAVSFYADVVGASTRLTAAVPAGNTTFPVADASRIAPGDRIFVMISDTGDQYTVASATATTITVTTGAVSAYSAGMMIGRPRLITYIWDGANTLSKDAGDAAGRLPLADGIQAFDLRYFNTAEADITGAVAANLGSIRRIRVSLTGRSGSSQNEGVFTVTSSVRPRNL